MATIASIIAAGADGSLQFIKNCTIAGWPLKALPEIDTGKSANYTPKDVIGRSSPLMMYQSSAARTITLTIHCHSLTKDDMVYNINLTRALFACLYPQYEAGYAPPPLVKFNCGVMYPDLSCIMTSVSVGFSSDVVWDQNLMVPRSWDIQASLEVVYSYKNLPSYADVRGGSKEITPA